MKYIIIQLYAALLSLNLRPTPPVPVLILSFFLKACPKIFKNIRAYLHISSTSENPRFFCTVMRIVTTHISIRCGDVLLILSAQSITVISSALKLFLSTAATGRSGMIDFPILQGIAIMCQMIWGLSKPICSAWCTVSIGNCKSWISKLQSAGWNLSSKLCLIEMCISNTYISTQFLVKYWFVTIGHSPLLKLYRELSFQMSRQYEKYANVYLFPPGGTFHQIYDQIVLKASFPLSRRWVDSGI